MGANGEISVNPESAAAWAKGLRDYDEGSYVLKPSVVESLDLEGVPNEVRTVLKRALKKSAAAAKGTREFAEIAAERIDERVAEYLEIDGRGAYEITQILADLERERRPPTSPERMIELRIILGELNADGSPVMPSGPGHQGPRMEA